jgi:hypothetical protein
MSLGLKTQYFEELKPAQHDYLSQGRNYRSIEKMPAGKYLSAHTFDIGQDWQDLADSSRYPNITQNTSTKHHYKLLRMPSDEIIYHNSYSSYSDMDQGRSFYDGDSNITSLASQSLAHYIPGFVKIIGFGALVIASIWTYYNWSKVVSWFDGVHQDTYDYFYPSPDYSQSLNDDIS